MKFAPRPRRVLRNVFAWGLAVAALVFVARHLPLRDRCFDPEAAASTAGEVTRGEVGGGCVLHLTSGDIALASTACARLKCEPGLLPTLGRARPAFLAALFALYMLGTVIWAARWRALLGFAGIDWPLVRVWRIAIEAQAGGVLLPGGVGGDAFRVGAVLTRRSSAGHPAPVAIVVASVLLDRVVGLALIALVAGCLGLAFGGGSGGSGPHAVVPLAFALLAIPGSAFAGLAFARSVPRARLGGLLGGRVERVLGPVLDYLRDPRAPRAIALAALLSVGVAVTQFAVVRGLIFALGATPASEKWVYVGTAMAFIVGAIPALPGGWGTADAAYVFFFGLAGLGSGVALAVSLIFRLFWYCTGAIGAVLHVLRRNRADSAAREPQSHPKATT